MVEKFKKPKSKSRSEQTPQKMSPGLERELRRKVVYERPRGRNISNREHVRRLLNARQFTLRENGLEILPLVSYISNVSNTIPEYKNTGNEERYLIQYFRRIYRMVARSTAPENLDLRQEHEDASTSTEEQERTPSGRLAARRRSEFTDPSKSASARANRRDKQVGTSHDPRLMDLLNRAVSENPQGKKQIVQEGIILRLQELGYEDELEELGFSIKNE